MKFTHSKVLVAFKLAFVAATAVAGVVLSQGAAAQTYPNKPIRLIVPYPPGGGVDFISRTVFGKVGNLLGQPFIVENHPGAGSTIGSELVAKSPPDGYTLLIGDMGTFAFNSSLYKNLRYDPQKSFAPISLTGRLAFALVVNPDVVPVKTMDEFIQYAKQNPGKINYAAPGPGSPLHIAMDLFKQRANINLVAIPYKGGGDAIKDLLGGQVGAMFLDIATGLAHLQGGKLRAIAVSSVNRLAALPDVPTVRESGIPGFEAYAWQGFAAPVGTPPAVIAKINTAFVTAMKDPEIRKRFADREIEPLEGTPLQFVQLQSSEIPKWAEVIRKSNISLD